MKPAGASVRADAARVITAVLAQGRSLKAELAAARDGIVDPRDKALLEAICLAVIRHRRSLEFGLQGFLQKGLQRQDPLCHHLLLAGLAQLHLLKLSEHAAVSATVEASRLLGRAPRAGLVNAVLRRSVREGLAASADTAVANDHPDWLLRQLQADWPEHWRDIVQANNRIAPLWLRACAEPAAVAAALRDAGIGFARPEFPGSAVRLDSASAPTQLPGWREGHIAVQDFSAQLPALALAVQPGETVWDMCAAPGGKSAQLAQARPARLLLTDSEADRLPKIGELFARLGLGTDGLLVEALDAASPLPERLPQAFDAILLDAPCSATGIIRRQPDVKWHRRAKDIGALNGLQWRLLKNAWRHLKPGGRLLYSTCSVLPAENAALINQFLGQNPDARALPLPARFGRVSGAGRQRLPGDDDGDGFFYALLERS